MHKYNHWEVRILLKELMAKKSFQYAWINTSSGDVKCFRLIGMSRTGCYFLLVYHRLSSSRFQYTRDTKHGNIKESQSQNDSLLQQALREALQKEEIASDS